MYGGERLPRSATQVPPALPQVVGAPEREGLDGCGRVHASARGQAAAIDDVEVGNVVRPIEGIDHRIPRVRTHPSGPEEVPAPYRRQTEVTHRAGSGSLQHLVGVGDYVVSQSLAVVTQRVPGPNAGKTELILVVPIEHDPIRLFREVLAAQVHDDLVVQPPIQGGVVARTPGGDLQGEVERGPAPAPAHDEAASVRARGVRLVELTRGDGAAPAAAPAFD